MKYQLRLMVLLNAGTNQDAPSGRITAIDPRGGAAVLGENGVGKTTTLRILPLFFGHLPSQIVSSGQGQEPMVRYILPTDASAIAFEYQRGPEEADLRLAVIRRRSDLPDVPFYRLYRCGFRKELFVSDGRFLDDEETQVKATALGIMTTGKLSTPEYRSVILRTPASSKEKDKLRRHSLEWSYGPKGLDNLDRLVAAMVKKHINFADIVQVAVGLVQQDLGHGSERAKLTFKQGRGHIEHWLRNREACAEAFKLAPKLEELENMLSSHRAAEGHLRSCRTDTNAVRAARVGEQTALAAAIEKMGAARQAAVATQLAERVGLLDTATKANEDSTSAKEAFDGQAEHAARYEKERAEHWEGLISELPSLRQQKRQLENQVTTAESEKAEATTKYERLKNEAATATNRLVSEREQEKQPHRDRLALTIEQVGEAEEVARALAEEQAGARQDHLIATLEPLIAQKATWQARKDAPAASNEAAGALDLASGRLDTHKDERSDAADTLSALKAEEGQARQAFTDQERTLREARAQLATANAAFEAAQVHLNPTPGTFLAALRQHGDDAWKRALAKVVNPALLERDDLNPTAVEDAAQTIYGWQLDTGILAVPGWADDALARQAVIDAQTNVGAAQAHHASMGEDLAGKGRLVKAAEQATGLAQAALDVLVRQSESLKTQLATAKQRVESEKRQSQTLADGEMSRLGQAIATVRAQQKTAKTELLAELATVKRTHEQLRGEARTLHDDALADIDKGIRRLKAELETTLKDLTDQLDEHLSVAGVDVKRLAALKSQVATLGRDIEERDAKVAMVDSWRKWVAEGGTTRLEALRSTAERAKSESQRATTKLSEFDAASAKAALQYDAQLDAKTRRQTDVLDELKVLDSLENEFGNYQAIGASVIDTSIKARELRGQVQAARADLDAAVESVTRRFGSLRSTLTSKESAVKELVELSLAAVPDANQILRAEELCRCYKQIGPQVANDVNLVLKTLLANIGAFQKDIQSFEKEVSSFNKRLQAGLTAVRCFERIKDLRLDIITNFDNLGFYKKLARMDDIVRQHANERGKDPSRDLPSDETARALGEFMSVLGTDGSVEVTLSSHITLKGSVTDNGKHKEFKRASELENISSEGLTSLVLITLMTALLNTVRGAEPVHVPWVTDEVGKFDPKNFRALMNMLRDNHIDVVTASPELGSSQQAMFARHYLFEDRGRIREFVPRGLSAAREAAQSATEEALS
jgi:DNA repair exonuclease SbcCD ATPase subunit